MATLGLFAALLVVIGVRMLVGEEAFAVWGWRVPFLVSMALLVVSMWIRMQLDESTVLQKMKDEGTTSKAPLTEAFGKWSNLKLVIIALFGTVNGSFLPVLRRYLYPLPKRSKCCSCGVFGDRPHRQTATTRLSSPKNANKRGETGSLRPASRTISAISQRPISDPEAAWSIVSARSGSTSPQAALPVTHPGTSDRRCDRAVPYDCPISLRFESRGGSPNLDLK